MRSLYASSEPVWEELTPMPEGRAGMISFLTDQSEPAYYGGSSWDDTGKQIHSSGYSLRSGKWDPLKSLKEPIAYAAVAGAEGMLYAAGGTDGIGLRSTLFTLNSNLQQSKKEIIPSQARIYAGAAFLENAFYQVGGSIELSPLSPCAVISKFEHGSWNDVGKLAEGPLINPAVASWKGNILIFGGGIPKADGLKNTDSVYSFDPKEESWTKQANLPAPTRGAAAITVPDVGVLVIGGYVDPSGFSEQILLFDPQKNQFHSLARLPAALMLPAVVSNGKWVYIFGGEDAAKHRSPRVFRAGLSKLIRSRGE